MIRITMILIAILCTRLNSQTKTFNSVGNWHNATLWTPNGVPQVQDSVVIFGTAIIEADSTAYARHVRVEENWVLQIDRDLLTNKPGRLNLMPFNMTEEVGLEIDGTLIQGGRLDINGYTDKAIINNGILVTQDRSKTITDGELRNNGKIEINGELEIDSGLNGTGIYHLGDSLLVNDSASIEILNGETGIFISYDSNVISEAPLHINGFSSSGIFNFGRFILSDSLVLSGSSGDGLYNGGYFEINSPISIKSGLDDGLINYDTMLNNSMIVIDSVTDDGLYNDGYFKNNLIIQLSYCGDISVETYQLLDNHGVIHVDGAVDKGLYIEYDMINEGFIFIKYARTGIELGEPGSLVNNGAISIDSISEIGIESYDDLINNGVLTIQHLVQPNAIGFLNRDFRSYIQNIGTLILKDIDSIGIVNSVGTIRNLNVISIEAAGHNAIVNEDSLFNDSTGLIEISDSGFHSLSNNIGGFVENSGILDARECESTSIINSGVFINHDTIIIKEYGFSGLVNKNEFVNSSGSYLLIENDGYSVETIVDPLDKSYLKQMDQPLSLRIPSGILNSNPNDVAMITNEGKIEILECVDAIRNVGQFTNMDTMLIYDVYDIGINNAQISEGSSADIDFVNSGYIDMRADFGLLVGIATVFINEESGVLKIVSDDDEPLIVELGGILDCFGELDISSGMGNTGTGQ